MLWGQGQSMTWPCALGQEGQVKEGAGSSQIRSVSYFYFASSFPLAQSYRWALGFMLTHLLRVQFHYSILILLTAMSF